jgi:MoaA/NifB/PqqE/SkfB family radical SAM enzyme
MNEPEKIVKSGLNVIQITLDGLTQEQHQIYRKGSDLEIVLKNIRSLVLARKKLHSFWPKIYINTLINKHNEKDYRLFIKQAKKLSVNGIKFTGIIDDLFKTSDLLPLSGKFKHSPRKNGYKCRFQKLIFGILSWDGDIQLCCLTPNHNNPVIKCNAFEEKDLLKTLDSEEFLNLTKKSGNYQFCEECFLKNNSSYLKEIALDWMPIWLLRRLTILKRDPLKATSLFIRKILNS